MTIGRKIALGFACLIVLSIGSGLYLLQFVRQMGEQSRRLVEVDYRAGKSALQLHNRIYEVDEFTRKLFATSRPEPYAAALQERIDAFSLQLDQTLALELSPADREAFQNLERQWLEFRRRLDPFLNTGRSPDRESSSHLEAALSELFSGSREALQATQSSLLEAAEASRHTTQRAQLVPWISAALALLLTLGLAFAIVRSITKPVRELVNATQQLSAGDFSSRVKLAGTDEISELARNFNRMVRRLEELDQLKRDFVSHVSHDLKAPLASIQETTSVLLEGIPGPLSEKQQRLLQLNLNCSRRLSAMINNLLDLSRLEAGVARYDFQETDFRPLVEAVVAEVEPLASEKGCRLRARFEGDGIRVHCDSGRMMQVVRNLLDNAVNFSPPGGEISVGARLLPRLPEELPDRIGRALRLWQDEPFLQLEVLDRGPGIDLGHQSKIFEKFHQVQQGGKVRGQGVGLGLAICKSIVEAHGGGIWVEDNPEGGSCFCFVLPVSGPPEPARAPAFSTF